MNNYTIGIEKDLAKLKDRKLSTVRPVIGDWFQHFKANHRERLNWLVVFNDFRGIIPTVDDKNLARAIGKVLNEIGQECEKVTKWNLK